MTEKIKNWKLNTSLVFLFIVGISTVLIGLFAFIFGIRNAVNEAVGSLLASLTAGYFMFYIPIRAIFRLKKLQ